MSKRVCIHERVDTREHVYDHSQSKHVSLGWYYYCVDVVVCVFYWHSKMDDLRRGSFFWGGGHSNRRFQRVGRFLRSIWPNLAILTRTLDSNMSEVSFGQSDQIRLIETVKLRNKETSLQSYLARRTLWMSRSITSGCDDHEDESLRSSWATTNPDVPTVMEGLCVLLQWNNKRRGTGNKMSR